MDPEGPTIKRSEQPADESDAEFESLLRKAARAAEYPAVRLPRPGDVLAGKYRIEERLGQGGMGAVFRATHLVSEKPIAIKWMLRSPSDERARRRFVREARVTGRIDHPNVVDVYDISEQPDGDYLVMELLHGETLRVKLGAGLLGVTEAIDLLLPAMRGVSAVHKAGVVHRDLKPDNIFLCRDPAGVAREAKVLDFGISCLLANDAKDSTLTNEGALLGTPAYMSPEQIQDGLEIDARTDVYSFGVILYEMLTGSLPFSAASNLSLMVAITTTQPRHPNELRPELPLELGRIVVRALEKDREQRYASVDSLIAALLPYSSAKSADTPQPPLTGQSAVARPARAVWVSVAASAIVLLAIASWLISKNASRASSATQAPATVVNARVATTAPKPATPDSLEGAAHPKPSSAVASAATASAVSPSAATAETSAGSKVSASALPADKHHASAALRSQRSATTTSGAAPALRGGAATESGKASESTSKRRAGSISVDEL
jgi:serine/threonine-protein kinase